MTTSKEQLVKGMIQNASVSFGETPQDINIVTKRIMHFKKQGISKSFYSYLFGLHWNKVYGSSKVVIWQISFQKYVTKCRNSK